MGSSTIEEAMTPGSIPNSSLVDALNQESRETALIDIKEDNYNFKNNDLYQNGDLVYQPYSSRKKKNIQSS